MKSKIVSIFWGIVLIIVSGFLAAEALGDVSFGSVAGWQWALVFAIASVALFLTYCLNGVKQWGWLFPALICAALGWSCVRTGRAFDPLNLDWPILAALAIPLYVGFALDRKRWGLLIPAYLLTVLTFMNVSVEMTTRLYQTAGVYRTIRLRLVADVVQMFLFALPFFVIYFWSKKNWWALMPAGALTSIGLTTALSILIPKEQNALTGVRSATLLLGFAATLGVLWLRRATYPTDWAKYPAAGFLALAIAALLLGRGWLDLSQDFKSILFAAGSVAFFAVYLWQGVRQWGWLFPALFCAALALTIWMENRDIGESITGLPLFAGAAVPFFVGYAMDRKRRGLLIPAILLTAFTIFLLFDEYVPGEWSGAIFLCLCALPCFVIYFWWKKWWALIPAGAFASLGLVVLVEILIPHEEYPTPPNTLSFDVYTWVLFLSLAATFGAVWLHHKTEPTDWAKYPAAGLLAISVLGLLLREHFQEVWLAAMTLVTGVMLLLAALSRKKRIADQLTLAGKA